MTRPTPTTTRTTTTATPPTRNIYELITSTTYKLTTLQGQALALVVLVIQDHYYPTIEIVTTPSVSRTQKQNLSDKGNAASPYDYDDFNVNVNVNVDNEFVLPSKGPYTKGFIAIVSYVNPFSGF
ncbi:hypothetical protein M0804_007192 [Polistes exclamans]|nr:hypothetical protein M0804_007192 [Polistes exclamans]